MTPDRRHITTLNWVIQSIIPVALLALVSWISFETVQSKVDRTEIRFEVKTIQAEIVALNNSLDKHNELSLAMAAKTAVLHHRKKIGNCTECHENGSNGDKDGHR